MRPLKQISTNSLPEAVSQELLNTGWTLYEERAHKEWGLTDCTSFVVMSRERVVQAFTFDHHFEQAGFTNLLKA